MENFELKKLIKTITNKKWYIIAILILCISIGTVYSFYGMTPMYQSSTTIILASTNDDSSGEKITQGDITLNQKLVATYTQIIKSNKVLRTVIDNLGLDMSETALNSSITVTAVSNTEMLKVSVINEDAEKAALITNEIGRVFSLEVSNIYNLNNVNIIDHAEVAKSPYNINHIRDIMLAGFAGVFVSAVFIVAVFFLDDTIKVEEDVESYIGLNVLSNIPLYSKNIKRENKKKIRKEKIKQGEKKYKELIVFQDSKSPIAEFFKTLRANILFTKPDTKLQTILITSGMQAEGKSWISSNLAVAFAQSNKKVLLVDADMRKGRLHHIFQIVNRPGLSNILTELDGKIEAEKMEKYIKETEIPNLHVVTSGDRPPNPSELVSSGKMQEVLNLWKKMYDIIILDGTPCMIVSDSVVLSRNIDTTVIVAESKKTKIDNTNKVKKAILAAGGSLAGIVINKVELSVKSYNDRYYYNDKEKRAEIKKTETIEGKSVKEIIQELEEKELDTSIKIPEIKVIEEKKEEKQEKIIKREEKDLPAKGMYIENYYGNDTKVLDKKIENLNSTMQAIKQTIQENEKEKQKMEIDFGKITEEIEEVMSDYQEKLETKLQEGMLENKERWQEELKEIKMKIANVTELYEAKESKEEERYYQTLGKEGNQEERIEQLRKEIVEVKQMLKEAKKEENSNLMQEEKENLLQELEEKYHKVIKPVQEEITSQMMNLKEEQQEKIEQLMQEKIVQLQKENQLKQQEIITDLLAENRQELIKKMDSILEEMMLAKQTEEENKLEKIKEEMQQLKEEFSKIEISKAEEFSEIKTYLEEMNAKTIQKMEKDRQEREKQQKSEEAIKPISIEEVRKEPKYKKMEMKIEKRENRGLFGKKEKQFHYGEEVNSEELEETASYVCQILRPERVS